MKNLKLVKTAAAVALGATFVTSAVAATDVAAASKYEVKSSKLVVKKTGKAAKGYVTFNKVLYKDGKKFTGINKSAYYKNGVKATGTYKGAYYVKGVKKVTTGTYQKAYYEKGIKKVTTGLYKSKYYKSGALATGTYKGAYYVKGSKKVTTGEYNKAYYVKGVKQTKTGVYGSKLYVNGTLSSGLFVFENKLYKDGKRSTELVMHEGVLYNKGVPNEGFVLYEGKLYKASALNSSEDVVLFEGKYYKDADLATGTYNFEGDSADFVEGSKVVKLASTVETLTKTNVKITFPALTANDPAFKVIVKDGSGNIVRVNAVALEKGETEATLTFKTALADEPTGKWNVGGVVYDLDAIKFFNDIVEAANTSEPKTLEALNKAGIQHVKVDYITDYVTNINGSTTKATLTDIQTIINEVNTNKLTASEEVAAVKGFTDATNQVQLLAALNNKAFKNVNPDWIADYASSLLVTPRLTTVIDIQLQINNINIVKVDTAFAAAKTASDLQSVNALAMKFILDDVAPATFKQEVLKGIEIQSAYFNVNEATTQATLYNALEKYAKIDMTIVGSAPGYTVADLNPNLKADYLTAKTAASSGFNIKTHIIDVANASALSGAANGIVALETTSTDAEVKAALQKLANVTSHTADKFDMTKVKDSSLPNYKALLAPKLLADVNTAAKVTALIASENASASAVANLAKVKSPTATAAEIRDALIEIAALNASATSMSYLNASSAVKLEVAQMIKANQADLADPLTAAIVVAIPSGTTNYVVTPLAKAMLDQSSKVAQFNSIGAVNTRTLTDITTALDNFGHEGYLTLSATEKLKVAENIKNLTKPNSVVGGLPIPLNFSVTDSVTTIQQANAYIEAAMK